MVSITLWPTDVASSAQKSTLKTMLDADGDNTQVALLVGGKIPGDFITIEDKKMPAKGGPKSEVCKGRDGPLRGEGSRRMTTH